MKRDRNEKVNRVPQYPLQEVRKLIDLKRVSIWPNAIHTARNDFGWSIDQILMAIKRLQERHFYKKAVSEHNTSLVMDFYKAKGLCGEDIYTHFFIDDSEELLVINSFKKL